MKTCILITLTAFVLGAVSGESGQSRLKFRTVNPAPRERTSQTIEIPAVGLIKLGETNLQKIHVRDATGAELLCQAADTDFDAYRRPDVLIFQTDFKPGEARQFEISAGEKQVYRPAQFKAHGRFVRERFEDFAWENDRIAHRMYGKALETWAGEPLASSTVDIWSKRVPRMVVDEWYMADNYHVDTGEGADFYSAGPSRGCGGSGLWAAEKLWVSRNFVQSRVMANGPIRVMFELVYEPFEADGRKVTEIKRITLDAGSQLDRFQSFYRVEGGPGPLTVGVGLKKVPVQQKFFDREKGVLITWEKVAKEQGMQGLAVVAQPEIITGQAEDPLNHLILLRADEQNSVEYWAGFCWDKAGEFTNLRSWQSFVQSHAADLKVPIQVLAED